MASKVQRSSRWFSCTSGNRVASEGVAPSRRAVSRSWSSDTKRNSACGSINRRMSQGQATRSTLAFCRVIHLIDSPLDFSQGLVEPFSQLYAAFKQFLIAEVLPCPPFHHFIDAKTFFAAKFLVEQVGVVNDLSHHTDPLVTDSKRFREGFKRTVLTTVPETSLVHV